MDLGALDAAVRKLAASSTLARTKKYASTEDFPR